MKRLLVLLAACAAKPAPVQPMLANTQPAAAPSTPLGARELRGTIVFPGAGFTPGTSVFVIAKPAAGGTPIAVDKLVFQGLDLAFSLTEDKALVGGTDFTGDVEITVRYDQDGDAITKQPGDRIGKVRATIPADNLRVVVDQTIK